VTTPGVDFFRIDRSGPTKRVLIVSGFMVSGGATVVGAHLVNRLPADVSHLISLVGGICVIGGLVLGFGTLAMMLFENVYLSIRDEGLLVHDSGRETTIAWDELTKVVVDAKGVIELRRDKKEPVRWFAGKTAKDVAARIQEAKRKAAHGLLKTGSNPPSAS
jgi:hypothetical protein